MNFFGRARIVYFYCDIMTGNLLGSVAPNNKPNPILANAVPSATMKESIIFDANVALYDDHRMALREIKQDMLCIIDMVLSGTEDQAIARYDPTDVTGSTRIFKQAGIAFVVPREVGNSPHIKGVMVTSNTCCTR